MKTANSVEVKNNSSELFILANKLRKKMNMNQKEAFAAAKTELNKRLLRSTLVDKMMHGVVTIKFTNRKGKEEMGKATLCPVEIPNRAIGGRKESKNDEWITFYEKKHGMFRSILVSSIISFE